MLFSGSLAAQPELLEGEPYTPSFLELYQESVIDIGFFNDTTTYCFVSEPQLYDEGWKDLAQVRFWRLVMNLDPAVSVLNNAETREVYTTLSTQWYNELEGEARAAYKDSMLTELKLPEDSRLYVTEGRKHYYLIEEVMPQIHHGIQAFLAEGVDPWYAQAILLIESPGEMRVSPVGASGPFQLMTGIAREMGLTVNESLDERQDFNKSARAAARFIREVCIPHTEAMLQHHRISYRPTDLWFRLMVMHVYHAGAATMRGVLRNIQPLLGGMPLIMRVWKTHYRRFGNASQNYSQIALAALMELEDRIYDRGGFFIPTDR